MEKTTMLIVQFSCIDFKTDIENLNKEEYVNNIFLTLSKEGYINSFVIDNTTDEIMQQKAVQEYKPNIYRSRHVYKQRDCSGDIHIVKSSYVFEIQYVWGTYNSGLQLSVSIFSNGFELNPRNDYIEKLKIKIKDIVIRDWGKIEWLVDKDSECLAVDLYPEIFSTENLIRQMISEIMMKIYGTSWWDKFVSYDIQNKYKSRVRGYKRIAPGFANIDDHLLSIDIGDLIKILSHKFIKWQPEFDDEINLMLCGKTEWRDNKIKEILEKQMSIEIDFWDRYFSNYLPEDFLEKLSEYEKNRNHVAHNKILDRQAYQAIKNNVDDVQHNVRSAIQKISENIISTEERERINEAIAVQEAAYEAIIKSETGVKIRNYGEIQDILEEAFSQLCSDVEEAFYFREDIEIETSLDSIIVLYKIDDRYLTFKTSSNINDEQGASSVYEIYVEEDDNFIKKFEYINGEVEFNEEQTSYYPITEDEEPDVESTTKSIIDYINEEFPNLRQEADAVEYKYIKDGGEPLVLSDIPCEECGEFYIAANDILASKGTCLNCGAAHEIHTCSRCGICFEGIVDDGFPELCDNCINWRDNE